MQSERHIDPTVLISRQPYSIQCKKKKKNTKSKVQKMNVSEQRTDWPPYLRLQVSDLMMKKELLLCVCSNLNLNLTL